MNEKRAVLVIPFVLLVFAALFAESARRTAHRVGGSSFDAETDLYIPAVFFISGIWSIRFTLKSADNSLAIKMLLVAITLLGVALTGYAMYTTFHHS